MLSKEIVINAADFVKGIQSPYVGIEETRCLDISSIPGILKINGAMTANYASGITSLPYCFSFPDITTFRYGFCQTRSNQLLGKIGVDGVWGAIGTYNNSATGCGIIYWQGYLFIFTSTSIDLIDCTTGSVTTAWKTISTATVHPAIVGLDNILYFGVGNSISSVEAVGTFNPSNSSTYTYSTGLATIPTNEIITTMVEYGEKIYFGTDKTVGQQNQAKVYGFDRFSVDANLPVIIAEDGIKQMIVHNNYIYIVAGAKGHVYVSNGVSAKLLAVIPEHLSLLGQDAEMTINPYAITVHNGKILTAIGAGLVSAIFGITTDGVVTVEHIISRDLADSTVNIGSIMSTSGYLYSGWTVSSTSYGVDELDGDNPYDDYAAYFTSQFYRVGTSRVQMTTSSIEIVLAKPLISGQAIKLEYRKNNNDSWIEIGTMSYVSGSDKDNRSRFFDFGVTTENIQIKASFDTPNSVSNNNINLLEIRIK